MQINGALIVDHDISKTAILESTGDLDIEQKKLGKISYHVDWALIDFYLSQGFDVIFDAPCLYSEMVDHGTFVAKKYGAKYKYVECYLNDYQEISKRLQSRNRMISQIPGTTEEAFKTIVDGSKRPTDIKCLIVDSSQPLEQYFHDVLNYLNEE